MTAIILALDQGTTGTTVLAFDREARLRGRAYREITQHYPRPGWVEHDPEEIWDVTRATTQRALGEAGATASDVVAVGITNQRETTVLWERASGNPVAPAIVWQDRRTAEACEALVAAGHEALIRDRTGLVVDPYFSGTKLRWLLDANAERRRRAEAGELAFGTIDTWLIHRLTGGRVHATEPGNASRTLLFDIGARRWDPELLDLLGVPKALLPEVRPSAGTFGETDPDAFFGIHAPIAGVAGDQQAALFGQGCHVPGMAKNTYGTGSFLLLNTGTAPAESRAGLLTTIGWALGDAATVYALEGAIFVTGAAVQWLRDGLGLITEAAQTEALASSVPSTDGVCFVPALTGLGAPHWDPRARGTLVGLTRGTSRAHVVRAVLESIAWQTRDVVDAMQRDSGVALRELRCDGGATANGFLMQFQADVLGVPVIVPELAETTALGAALLAGVGAGIWAPGSLPRGSGRERRYEPQLPDAECERQHARWLEAVERSKGWARD